MPSVRPLSLACSAVLLLAACATGPRIDAQWTDPQFQGRSLRGATVLVVCEARDLAIRRTCQDRLAGEVTALGATPRIAGEIANPTPGREQLTSAYLPAARAAGARAVFSAAVVETALPPGRSGTSIGVGLGGYGGGRVGIGGGIGFSLPIGGTRSSSRYDASGALTDVASGQLMWSAKVSTPTAPDVAEQLGTLARALGEGAAKAGFF